MGFCRFLFFSFFVFGTVFDSRGGVNMWLKREISFNRRSIVVFVRVKFIVWVILCYAFSFLCLNAIFVYFFRKEI